VLTPALADRLLDTCAEVWNAYGPTETTDAVTWCRVTRADTAAGVIPIGHPMPGRLLRIADETGELAGVGVEGELLIGGRGVARGYRARPDLTADAFIAVETDDGVERMYRSGDRCRWRHDGMVEFVGRVDGQVKVQGIRVELGEVEAALARHERVTAAAVDVRGGRLVAWVVGPEPPSTFELQRFLSTVLPRAMVPVAIMPIGHLPALGTGKVDRAALVDPPVADSPPGATPNTPLEVAMAELWTDIIGADHGVFLESDFFALGGDSLMAVSLLVEIENRFFCTLPVSTIFEHSTLAGLVAAVEAQRASGRPEPRPDPVVVVRRGRGTVAPVFWVPGSGGTLIVTRRLANEIDSRADVYGFEHAVHRSMPEPASVADMAHEYVNALERMGVTTFVLGGSSFGALVAHEMACQLAARGAPPTTLVLIDPRFPGVRQRRVGARLWLLEVRAKRWWNRLRPSPTASHRPLLGPPPRIKATSALSHRLSARHSPGAYSGDTVVLTTREYRQRYGRRVGIGRHVRGPFAVVRLPGQHSSAIKGKPVTRVAAAIDAVLHRIS
jgi:thioesterase domain-containing protein/acyl carrier protein